MDRDWRSGHARADGRSERRGLAGFARRLVPLQRGRAAGMRVRCELVAEYDADRLRGGRDSRRGWGDARHEGTARRRDGLHAADDDLSGRWRRERADSRRALAERTDTHAAARAGVTESSLLLSSQFLLQSGERLLGLRLELLILGGPF